MSAYRITSEGGEPGTITANGGTEPYSWSVTGTLPAKLKFDESGAIVGEPEDGTAGTYNLTFKVTDDAGGTDTKQLTLIVGGLD